MIALGQYTTSSDFDSYVLPVKLDLLGHSAS